jgi:hypothetical protein
MTAASGALGLLTASRRFAELWRERAF